MDIGSIGVHDCPVHSVAILRGGNARLSGKGKFLWADPLSQMRNRAASIGNSALVDVIRPARKRTRPKKGRNGPNQTGPLPDCGPAGPLRERNAVRKLLRQFFWFFRIGWTRGLAWTGDTHREEEWVHRETGERRIVRRRFLERKERRERTRKDQ